VSVIGSQNFVQCRSLDPSADVPSRVTEVQRVVTPMGQSDEKHRSHTGETREMSTSNTTMTLRGGFNARTQLIAILGVGLAAAGVVLAAWIALGFIAAPPAPATVDANQLTEQLQQHLLRENSVVAPATTTDWLGQHQQHVIRENSVSAPAYADYGQRQRTVPVDASYPDFGQRHGPAADR
jgi:hypothetical protein